MCVSLVNSDDFLNSEHFKSTLNEDGSIDVYYSAYSCDSSFGETLKYNFCPYCGRPISQIIEQYQKQKQDNIERLRLKAEQDKKKQIERSIEIQKNYLINLNDEVNKGNYNVYLYENEKYSAFNKKHLKSILMITNKDLKNAVLIERYQKHKLQK